MTIQEETMKIEKAAKSNHTCPKCGCKMQTRAIWKDMKRTRIDQCIVCKFYIVKGN